MSNIRIGAKIWVEDPSEALQRWCTDHTVITNPDYIKKRRMGKWLGNTPQKLYLHEWDGDTLVLPYGCLRAVAKYSKGRVHRDFGDPVEVDFQAKDFGLYDYQTEAVEAMKKACFGILQSPAGSGKTQIGIALAADIGRKTLWLTHTKDLLNQSRERACRYMPKELTGTITEGKVNIGKAITFATVQTMSKLDLSLYWDQWDTIIVDECHRVAGTPTAVSQFSKVLNSLAARHKYGLSATVHRSDGMIGATYALLGEVAYIVPEEAVADKIMRALIETRYTNVTLDSDFLDTDGTIIYAKLINHLCENFDRNCLICSDLVDARQHYNLVLSDRIEHLESLRQSVSILTGEDDTALITGKMTTKRGKAEREQALEDMRNGKKHYLFATYALAKEGLDIPRLDRLYLTTPQKDYAVITQSVGRVQRTFPGKETPIVYDYVDGQMRMLMRMYKKRRTTYRKLCCDMMEDLK